MQEKVNEVAVTRSERVWYQTVGSKVWYFFNSLTLTIFVLMTLAGSSIFGTVIEQNQQASQYFAAYGEKWTRVILYTGLNDMYHSWWFAALLGVLTMNIIVCTFERFPPKWKGLLANKSPEKFEPRIIDKCSYHQTLNCPGDVKEVRERVLAAFKKKRFKVSSSSREGGHYFYARKGVIGRFGSDVVHISLLLILLGAMVGSYYGYKDFRIVYVGTNMTVPETDFEVRLDKFWIDYYDTGQIRQYNSLLTVIEGEEEVLTKQIWVNEPLFYKGIRFYQSSFGNAWDRINSANMVLVSKKTLMAEGSEFTVGWNEVKQIPGSRYSIRLAGYTADFAYDERNNTVFSQTAEANNPAISVEVYEGERLVSTPWLFLKYPGIFPAIPDSEYDLVFTDYRGILYSGISLNKDPGTNIVWLGTGVMGLGFILAFFVFHRRVWVYVRENGGSTEVKLGGLTNKNNFVLEKDIKEIVENINAG